MTRQEVLPNEGLSTRHRGGTSFGSGIFASTVGPGDKVPLRTTRAITVMLNRRTPQPRPCSWFSEEADVFGGRTVAFVIIHFMMVCSCPRSQAGETWVDVKFIGYRVFGCKSFTVRVHGGRFPLQSDSEVICRTGATTPCLWYWALVNC